MDRISQSVAKRVPLKAFLSSDHISPGTGLTIAVVISKNGAAFGNPNAGATNATSIGNGWYYVDLDTTDTGTVGPLIVRGTEGTIDPSEIAFSVEADTSAPSAATIADAVWDEALAGHLSAGSTGEALDAAGSGAAVDVPGALSDMFETARSEPGQVAPAANATALDKLDFLHKLARNKLTQDATTLKVFADDGTTVDHKATVSDDGTTYTRGEITAGP